MSDQAAVVEFLLYSWDKNLDYAQKLVADVPGDRMVHQPAIGMNHPAWVLGHLNAYHPVIVSLAKGETFRDPRKHRFGMLSKPEADASVYPAKDELVGAFVRGHEEAKAALQAASAGFLDGPVTLERWKNYFPSVGAVLVYLMALHEATHLGQLSAWRRVQGMGSV